MKKSLLALAITLLLSTLSISAQTFEVKYYLSDFTVTRGADSLVTVTSKHRSFFAGDLQSPQLPFLSANILCAQGVTECNPVFSYEKEPIATGVLLNTIPPAYPTSIDPSSIDYTPQIARTSQSKPYNYEGVGQMMGYSFARIALSPFEYDYDTRTLYFIKSFVITLNERVSQQKVSAKNGSIATPRLGDPQAISDIVLNSNEIGSCYPQQQKTITREISPYNKGSLLIVTNDEMREVLKPYIEWKKLKGIGVSVLTVEEANQNYPNENNDQTLSIKYAIQNAYLQKHMDMVLLAGDDYIIPSKYVILPEKDSVIETTPCDLFYACFDNAFNWDANGNGTAGELNDNIDLYPEVYISRIPLNTFDMHNYINKLIQYETNPCTDNSFYNFFFAGSINSGLIGGISDTNYYSSQIMNNIKANGFHDIDYMFDTNANSSHGLGYFRLTKDNLISAINTSYNVIHFAGHGTPILWTTVYDINKKNSLEVFKVPDALNLINSNASIIVTTACNTCAYDKDYKDDNSHLYGETGTLLTYTKSLSEAFLSNSNGGAVAYLGSSRLGLFYNYPYMAISCSYIISDGFFQSMLALGNSSRRFGIVSYHAINAAAFDLDQNSNYRYLRLATNPLGDPDMDILLDAPAQLDVDVEVLDNGTVSISVGNVNSYNNAVNVVLMSQKDLGESYFYKTTVNNNSSTTINPTVPCFKIAITAPGYIPYIREMSKYEIEGDPIVKTQSTFYFDDLPSQYTVKWSLGNRITNNNNGIAMQSERFDDLIPSIPIPDDNAVLCIEENPDNSHECTVYHGNLSVADGENYEVPLIATLYLNGNIVGTIKKNIIVLSNLYFYVSQAEYNPYPGVAQFKVSDDCLKAVFDDVEIGTDLPIFGDGTNSIMRTPANRNWQHTSEPIYIFRKGRVTLTSPVFKYCTEIESHFLRDYAPIDNIYFDKEHGIIEIDIPYDSNSVYSTELSFYFGENYPKRTVYLVQVDEDETSINVLYAFVETVKVGFRLPDNVSRRNWSFYVTNISNGALVYTETGNISSDYTYILNFFSTGGTYILTATNADGLTLSTKFTKLPY